MPSRVTRAPLETTTIQKTNIEAQAQDYFRKLRQRGWDVERAAAETEKNFGIRPVIDEMGLGPSITINPPDVSVLPEQASLAPRATLPADVSAGPGIRRQPSRRIATVAGLIAPKELSVEGQPTNTPTLAPEQPVMKGDHTKRNIALAAGGTALATILGAIFGGKEGAAAVAEGAAKGVAEGIEFRRKATLAQGEADRLRRLADIAETRAETEAQKAEEVARHNQEMENIRTQEATDKAQATKESKSKEEYNKMLIEGMRKGVGYITDYESIKGDPQAGIPTIKEARPLPRASMAPTVRAEIEEREARTAEHRRKAEAPDKPPKSPTGAETLNQIKILQYELKEIKTAAEESMPRDELQIPTGPPVYTPEQKDRIKEIKARIKVLRAGPPSLSEGKKEPRESSEEKITEDEKKITGTEFDELKESVANFRKANMIDAKIREKLVAEGVPEYVLKMLGL